MFCDGLFPVRTSPAGRAFYCLIQIKPGPSAQHHFLDMHGLDWLTIAWLVWTMFLAALLAYVLLYTM